MKLQLKLFVIIPLICILSLLLYKSNYVLSNTNSEDKSIYLTFDDGPSSKVTSDILDILKDENVPATFFVIGNKIACSEDLILRMKNEGHSIGLHSYTHERDKLYCNNESFLKEMLLTQDTLFPIIGYKATILRFPFGANNNTYTLTNEMVDLLHNNQLKIYDWNQDSGDGTNPNLPIDLLVKNSISSKDNVVLLMHCSSINKNSAAALPYIINHYKDNGYEFKKITSLTPEIFRIKTQ